MADTVLKRKLYAMVVGVFGLLGGIGLFAGDQVSITEVLVVSILFTIPAIILLAQVRKLYPENPDPIEVVMMMIAGAALFLALSVSGISLVGGDIGVAFVALVIFGTPAAIFWIANSRRKTEMIATV
jgi:hypothetical protein